MSGGRVNISLGTKYDGTGVRQMKKGLASVGSSVKTLGRNLVNVQAGFQMLTGAAGKVGAFFSKAFRFETQTAQFKALVGDIETAKRHMLDLKELGDTPPFSLDEFAKASRAMLSMTDGALGFKDSLALVGDTAAATGRPLEEVARAVGRAFAFIRDGGEIMTAVEMLRTMGAVTPAVVTEMRELQAAGASNAEIWSRVEEQLSRFRGAMAETEETGDGLIGAIGSRWDNIVRSFGEAWMDDVKGGLKSVLDIMKDIEGDGTLGVWAAKVGEAMREAASAVRELGEQLDAVGEEKPIDMFDRSRSGGENMDHSVGQFFGNAWAQVGATGAYLRGLVMPGENAFDNYLAYGALHGYGGWSDATARKLNERKRRRGEWSTDMDIRVVREAMDEEIKAEAAEKAAEKKAVAEATAAKRQAEERQKIDKSLADAQEKTDKRNAEKKAEEAKKAAEKAAKEEKKIREKLEKDIEQAERERHKRRMDELREQVDAQRNVADAFKSVADSAKSEFDRAFAMYRDPSRAAAEIGEEIAYDKDLERLHKDAGRYGGRWRIDELSRLMSAGDQAGVRDTLKEWRKNSRFTPEIEAMVRASAAERTKTTAEEELRKIEHNTANLSKEIKELLAMKGGS